MKQRIEALNFTLHGPIFAYIYLYIRMYTYILHIILARKLYIQYIAE